MGECVHCVCLHALCGGYRLCWGGAVSAGPWVCRLYEVGCAHKFADYATCVYVWGCCRLFAFAVYLGDCKQGGVCVCVGGVG